MRGYSKIKTQTPNSPTDYSQTITKGFEFIGKGEIVTKLTISAETNLSLTVNGDMTVHLKQGTTWSIGNDDMYSLSSIVCDSDTANVCFILGYREK